MKEKLQGILQTAKEQLAAAKDSRALDEARVKFLGKKGELTALLKGMKDVAAEERPVVGQLINDVRAEIETIIDKQKKLIEQAALEKKLEAETIDVTLPGEDVVIGKKHPLNIVLDEFKEIFLGMGFSIAEGPEVELDHYNFEALNIPKDHPARDTQDTFYISDNVVLRTQTSPMQVRTMEKRKPPIRIIAPGRVYRSDAVDATHSPLFHQIEGLVVVYSWWSYRFHAREKNAGWRIDYFLVSDRFAQRVKDARILTDVFGSDHCPVLIEIE